MSDRPISLAAVGPFFLCLLAVLFFFCQCKEIPNLCIATSFRDFFFLLVFISEAFRPETPVNVN